MESVVAVPDVELSVDVAVGGGHLLLLQQNPHHHLHIHRLAPHNTNTNNFKLNVFS
jgi:hypothetical protein